MNGNLASGQRTAYKLLDTASDPDDSTVIAAPGVGLFIVLRRATIIVTVAQAGSSVFLEDSAGGELLGAANGALPGTTIIDYGQSGRKLSVNGLLNGSIAGATGVVAAVFAEFDEVS